MFYKHAKSKNFIVGHLYSSKIHFNFQNLAVIYLLIIMSIFLHPLRSNSHSIQTNSNCFLFPLYFHLHTILILICKIHIQIVIDQLHFTCLHFFLLKHKLSSSFLKLFLLDRKLVVDFVYYFDIYCSWITEHMLNQL